MRFAAFVSLMFAFANAQIAPYCQAGPTSAQDSNLGEVKLQQIDNKVDCPGQTGTQDHTDESATLVPGRTYTITWMVTTCGGPYNRASVAWIDWSGAGNWDNPTPLGDVQHTGDTPSEQKSLTFTVPSDAVIGKTRMRVMVQESSAQTLLPCGVFAYGGVKDFSIQISSSGGGGDSSGGLSGGSVFLILMVVAVVVYCGAGFALNKKNGSPDMIPHKEFWTAFPSYVASGFSYTFVCIKQTCSRFSGGSSSTNEEES